MAKLNFGKVVTRDFNYLMLGRELGSGAARRVFVFRPDPDYVVKIEDTAKSFQNIAEYEFWQRHQYNPKIADWLAPIKDISDAGTVLLQRRVTPISPGQMPEKVPAWLSDLKLEHFGMLDGRIVVCDYGIVKEQPSTRMVKNYARDVS